MMNLDDIIGQQAVTTHLRNALSKDKLAQAYMIIGEDGMGKETIAKAFASSILCEDRQPGEYLNCGKCRSCHQIETGNHPDLRVVTHEKPAAVESEPSIPFTPRLHHTGCWAKLLARRMAELLA